MYRPHIRGRRRILTQPLKAELCRLVAESATIEAAADTLDVSLRTVQRERKNDEDFDHGLRLALQAEPDPKRLMQTAARTHWRAAAWLLERTDPETYARRPVNTANDKQVEAALCFLLEAALQATPEEQRAAFFAKVNPAREQAFNCVFPNLGPWGNPRAPKCPPSPLTDYQLLCQTLATPRIIVDRDEEGDVTPPRPRPALPTFAEVQAAAAARAAERDRREARFREYREGLRCSTDPSEYVDPLEPDDDHEVEDEVTAPGIVSPKIDLATEFNPLTPQSGDTPVPTQSVGTSTATANDSQAQLAALDQQLRRKAAERRREIILSRKTRAATKRRKLLRKRARRNQLAR